MKKYYLTAGVALTLAMSVGFSSCIGTFALTNKVLSWNNQIGSKFVNELVFFALWVLPVYEVTSLADLLVINSIEFWSGENPVVAETRAIDTDHGRYLVECDGKGYTVTLQGTGESMRLNFHPDTKTWAVVDRNGEDVPFMTFVDTDHVRMYSPDGGFSTVELSESGVLAYQELTQKGYMAMK